MKLYVHSCDSRFPLTHVATISDDGSDTLGVVVASFLAEFNAASPEREPLREDDVFVCSKEGVEMMQSVAVSRLRLEHKDDVWIYFLQTGVRKLFNGGAWRRTFPYDDAIYNPNESRAGAATSTAITMATASSAMQPYVPQQVAAAAAKPPVMAWAFSSPAAMQLAAEQCSTIAPSAVTDFIRRTMGAAKQLVGNKQFRRARDLYEIALYLDPNCAEALEQLGRMRLELRQYHSAIDPLQRLVEVLERIISVASASGGGGGAISSDGGSRRPGDEQLRLARVAFALGQCHAGIVLDEWYAPPAVRALLPDATTATLGSGSGNGDVRTGASMTAAVATVASSSTALVPGAAEPAISGGDEGATARPLWETMPGVWPWPPSSPQCVAALNAAPPAVRKRFEEVVEQVNKDKRESRQRALRTFERVTATLNAATAAINASTPGLGKKSKKATELTAGVAAAHEQLAAIAALQDEVQLWTSRTLSARGAAGVQPTSKELSMAVFMLEGLVDRRGGDCATMLEYSKAACDKNKVRESIPVLFKALIANPKDAGVHRQMGRICDLLATEQQPYGGQRLMLEEMREAASSPAALSFIAQGIKDCGAVRQSIYLYERSVEACVPGSEFEKHLVNMTLTLVHAYEVCAEFQAAFDCIKRCLVKRMAAVIGGSLGGAAATLPVKRVLQVLQHVTNVFDPALRRGTAKGAQYRQVGRLVDAGVFVAAPPKGFGGDGATSTAVVATAEVGLMDPQQEASSIAPDTPCPYASEEIDLLAIVFTAIKILFGVGALQPIPELIELIEPVRRFKQLHLTTVRNEHAYYQCIAQLMFHAKFPIDDELAVVGTAAAAAADTQHAPALPAQRTALALPAGAATHLHGGARPLYVCGDSHSLSSAWHSLEWPAGERRVLHPRLVTGLKCHHMRPETAFFPKTNLFHVLDTIPKGADVIFVFGEIDCREGLLVATERARYECVDEGIVATVDTYFQALVGIQEKYQFGNMFIHPIVPVLDVTRPVVRKFNAALRARASMRRWPFRLLDFFDALLVQPSTSVAAATSAASSSTPAMTTTKATTDLGYNRVYELDGTHLAPTYVPLIEAALHALS